MNKPVTRDELASAQEPLEDAPAAPVDDRAAAGARRRKGFLALALAVAVIGGGWLGYNWFFNHGIVETDNAYVGADVAAVTPLVTGTVAQVLVSDAQPVKAGQILVILDQTDAQLALAEAEAAFNQAQRRVRGYRATDRQLTAQIAMRGAEAGRASAETASASAALERARIDFERREALAATGAISGEELSSARAAYQQARAGVAAAQAAQSQALAAQTAAAGQRDANQAMIAGAAIDDNPEVAAARARLERARLDLARTVIRAPVDGVIARRQVQVGQRVQTGAALMSVVPIQQAWVDANFKEGELAAVRPGQKVELEADLYGGSVTFHGTVEGLAGGTGSAFALIPAQNATGNWIKVVQRVPVRIRLDPAELKQHPLRVGLSMVVRVNTRG
ncbi:HlyD family efflux transporter periplasmic adaptor subunit [Sphingomonas canadensis]|uniref:HlyD family efflux transporter periplasmic adaptor subunit n=1 Tax=Sphingomonas canadensis TaxID=1219257 RepID=A0ABW3H1T4_9SPHN|nr:HlyD family efflux transporter periplasmic adaptor subunit [Sphingomonas canadensis]MCW3834665.1 HlyD family efflux transporter periplasmic adaptor subunit [Sphingomonas canadensis]